jgi:hypothetical protein
MNPTPSSSADLSPPVLSPTTQRLLPILSPTCSLSAVQSSDPGSGLAAHAGVSNLLWKDVVSGDLDFQVGHPECVFEISSTQAYSDLLLNWSPPLHLSTVTISCSFKVVQSNNRIGRRPEALVPGHDEDVLESDLIVGGCTKVFVS